MKLLHERTSHLDWEGLRLVLEIGRHGTLSGAARALGVEHSTVYRRLEQVEARLKTRLFERHRDGYTANARGEALLDAAREIEALALAAERRVLGADERLAGSVKVATSESLGALVLTPTLNEFLRLHPDIEIELLAANRAVDLARHEADLALRATLAPPESMVGLRIARLSFALYASRALIGGRCAKSALDELPWLGLHASLDETPQARYLRQHHPNVRYILRSDSMLTLLAACRGGAGIAPLACFLAAQGPELVRVAEVDASYYAELWLLMHPDLRSSARVRALATYLSERIPEQLAASEAAAAVLTDCIKPCPPPRRTRRRAAIPTQPGRLNKALNEPPTRHYDGERMPN